MATTVEIILKLTDKASKGFKAAGKSAKGFDIDLKGIAVAGGMALGTLGAIAVAGKKAFEWGKEGAAITQTAESFDLLMDKVGATPGLLDDLRDASRGTISDFELMSSTATLLAGASGELGTELANSTPKLMEIAKAANKLNPALGDTAFMYNSIATGVKRAQPLILDNLGLTIKVGTANEKMAKKLGKTVDALTAEEKSLAILNATLEAGDVMLEQVGGTTDSATDSFAELEVQVEEAGNSLKANLAEEMGPVIDRFFDMQEGTIALEEALESGIITQEEYADTQDAVNSGLMTMGEVTAWAKERTEEYFAAIDATTGPLTDYGIRMMDAATATEEAIEPTSLLGGAVSDLAGSFDAAKAAAQLMNEAIKLTTDGVAEAEKAKLIMALATGKLTDAEIEQNMADLATLESMEVLNKQIEDGKMTWGDYAVIMEDGEVSQREMNAALGLTVAPAGDAEEAMLGLGLATGETMDTLNEAKRAMIAIQLIMAKFEDVEFTVTGRLIMHGFGGSGSTPSGGVGGPPIYGGQFGRQRGGPVSAGSAYVVGEAGPELFVPKSSGDIVPNDKMGGDTFVIDQHFYNQEVAALAYDEIWRARDKRDNEFMGV